MFRLCGIKLSSALLLTSWILSSCTESRRSSSTENTSPETTPAIHYAVTKTWQHDTSLFTEGFVVHDGKFFESTGSPSDLPQARSLIGVADTLTGKLDIKVELDRSVYFGEGIVILNGKLYHLTYKNQTGFVYDLSTFKRIGEFRYTNKEGWGMTTDGIRIIMSDGTSALTFLDPESLKPVRTLKVTENGVACEKLNELEYIKGFIYANVWTTNHIVKIDPSSGKIVGKIDLTSLVSDAKNRYQGAEVLNGIAYDAVTDRVYVTGKLWPTIYQIRFAH
jgi:glutamine cyclotransferase